MPIACLNTFLLTPNAALMASGELLSDSSKKPLLSFRRWIICSETDKT
ncbi:hypothetical protein BMETH_354_0 [methanotrophic bacterial endosymbiont of Bathymodiolus sp.]|nr:hypothetical protein BMETH_354_0 [methanotrophic bacterial endosymbiont of Bathymodiolus sp.]